MTSSTYGLYRKKNFEGGYFPTYHAARDIPIDVRPLLPAPHTGKARFKKTLGTTSAKTAKLRAEEAWRDWGKLIKAARDVGTGPTLSLAEASHAVDRWRAAECLRTVSAFSVKPLPDNFGATFARKFLAPDVKLLDPRSFQLSKSGLVSYTARASALGFFERFPQASRSADLHWETVVRLDQLQRAADEDRHWFATPEFDVELDVALAGGGATAALPGWVRESLRPIYAKAALEIERHRELQRQQAVLILAADNSSPDNLQIVVAREAAFQPRPGDKTLNEVIERFLAEKARKSSRTEDARNRSYAHIFAALRVLFGVDKPFRAITRDDARDVFDLLARVPANASKFYPKATLKEAVELGERDCRAPISRSTLRSYISYFNSICTFALDEGWIDSNPARRLAPPKRNAVKRRGYLHAELEALFGSLIAERQADSARFWVPAILAFSGARMTEICQLQVADVKSFEGVPYLELSVFDDDGKRRTDAYLKTDHSERTCPIHPELIAAGFQEFVAKRKRAGETRLFPDLEDTGRGYGDSLSKWFARHRKAAGVDTAATTIHSFRHGFREAGNRAGVSMDVIDALGGWAPRSIGAGYGDRHRVADNAKHLAKIVLDGGFTLAP